MVAGHLQEKYGLYYIVPNYKDSSGKRKVKWESTGLAVRRNKKKAGALLLERCNNFTPLREAADIQLNDQVLFADFLKKWLELAKNSIQITTYANYHTIIQGVIDPYFREKGIRLVNLRAVDLQEFYTQQLKRVCANSVIHYHAAIHKALKYAVKVDLIPSNPADKVERPRKNDFRRGFYSAKEINLLLELVRGTKLEIPVMMGAFYGLRRSEALGLKWDAIDFEANTLEVKHIVTQTYLNGQNLLVQADRAKTKSSLRSLPLVPQIRDRLLEIKGQQEVYRKLCGEGYKKEYLGYLCVDEVGNIICLDYVTVTFPKFLEAHGLRRIRLHDLCYSCASLPLANGVPMKQWLGHSNFSTTTNIYAYLDYSSKVSSAQVMAASLALNGNTPG